MTATRAFLRTEIRLLLRNPAAVLFTMLLPVAAAIVIACIPAARRSQEVFGGLSVSEAYRAPLVLFATTMAALVVMPQTVGSYRELGYLKRLRATPASPAALLGAVAAVTALVAAVSTGVIVVVPLVLGVRAPQEPLLFALASLLTLGALLALGVMLSAVVPGPRLASGVGNVAAVLMWFAAGLWFPRAQFPQWLRTVCDLLPGGAGARMFEEASRGSTLSWQPVAVMLAWIAISGIVAVRTFRWE